MIFGFALILLMPVVGLVLLVAMGIVFGARAAASFVLVTAAVAAVVGLLVAYSFLSWVGGLFR